MADEPVSRPDDVESLLGAYALDAVDPDERAAVEQYLATHPRARAEVAQHQEVATLLAYTGAPAPDGVWDRIASSLDDRPPAPGPELAKVLPLAPPPPRRPARPWSRPGPVAAAVAAVAAAVIVALGVHVRSQDDRIEALEARVESDALEAGFMDALADPNGHEVALAPPGGGETAVRAALRADGTGYLQAEALPPLPPDQTYQLWGVTDAGVVSLGVLGADPTMAPFQAATTTQSLAITAERAPGVEASDQPPVVVGRVE